MFVVDQIASVLIMCQDKKFKSHREWILNITARMEQAGSLESAWDGRVGKLNPELADLLAEVEQSRWLAQCPYCASFEGVAPEEKIFFCMVCGMSENDHMALPVVFPEPNMIAQIQAALIERPVHFIPAGTRYERVVRQTPLINVFVDGQSRGLGRNWQPNQTVQDLRTEQDMAIEAWKEWKGN